MMRTKERIPNFLDKVDWKSLAERWEIDVILFNTIRSKRGTVRPSIRKYWEKEPDLRFGQMLINLGIMPDNLKIWNDEEYDILKDQGLDNREIMFWGRNYDENHNRLPQIQWILIKDMTTTHIEAILKDIKDLKYNIPQLYIHIFVNELRLRKELQDLL